MTGYTDMIVELETERLHSEDLTLFIGAELMRLPETG
jgi:hypothetical protein